MSDDMETEKMKSSEIQVGLLNKLVDGVAGIRTDVHDLRTETSAEFKEVRADIGLVSNDLRNTKEELRLTKEDMNSRFEKLETRADTSSIRAKQPSEQDLDLHAKLAQEQSAREAVERKVDALAQVNEKQLALLTDVHASAKKLLERPEVKWLAAALWMAFTAWLATKGIK